ncbi:uncharacterized protein LY79DRAFT_647970, partial [Colletotrichum navitas]
HTPHTDPPLSFLLSGHAALPCLTSPCLRLAQVPTSLYFALTSSDPSFLYCLPVLDRRDLLRAQVHLNLDLFFTSSGFLVRKARKATANYPSSPSASLRYLATGLPPALVYYLSSSTPITAITSTQVATLTVLWSFHSCARLDLRHTQGYKPLRQVLGPTVGPFTRQTLHC